MPHILAPRTQRLQKTAIGLLILAGVINYMDRSSLALAVVPIRQELHLSATAIGGLLSAFAFTYALAQLPIGPLIDRFGARRVLGCGMVLWSVAQAAAGFSGSYVQFLFCRVFLGVGEAPQFPSSARVIHVWYPLRARGLPAGLFGAGTHIAPIFGPPVLTLVMLAYGWRTLFIVLGVAGLLGAAVWWAFYRDPEVARVPAADLAVIRAEDQAPAAPVSLARWGRLFRDPIVWGMLLGNFGNGYCYWLFQAWLPGYLEMQRHVSIMRTGFYATLPEIFGLFGSLVGGVLADRLSAAGLSPVDARRYPIAVMLVAVAVFTVATAYAPSSTTAMVWICAVVFCSSVAGASIWALVNAVAPREYVATTGAIQNCGSFIGGTCSSLATGMIVDATGSFTAALVLAALISVVGAAIYFVVVRRPIDGARLAMPAAQQGAEGLAPR